MKIPNTAREWTRWAGLMALPTLVSCAPSPAPAVDPAARPVAGRTSPAPLGVIAAEPNIIAIAGRPLVIPLAALGGDALGSDWSPARVPVVSSAGGGSLAGSLFWFSASLRSGATARPADVARSWLPEVPIWRATRAAERRPATIVPGAGEGGFWALVVEVPESAGVGQLLLDGKTLPVRWMEPPPRTVSAAWSGTELSTGALRSLGELLLGEAQDPLRRWRVKLLADRLGARALWGEQPPAPMENLALEALAEQTEWRWRLAIRQAGEADAALGAQFLRRLTAVMRTPDGGLLPAWPLEDSGLLALRARLLDELEPAREKVEGVRRWLEANPTGIAWVIDESSPVEPRRGNDPQGNEVKLPTCSGLIAAADLSGQGAQVSVAEQGRASTPAVRIPAHESVVISMTASSAAGRDVSQLVARVGAATVPLSVRTSAIRAAPPGLVMGPFLSTMTMDEWLIGRAGVPAPSRATAAQLRRSVASGAWEIYVECRSEEGDSGGDEVDEGGDVVRVHIGASGKGRVIEIKKPPGAGDSDRWSAVAGLTPKDIEPGGMLRLGLERIDSQGGRSTWPRPVLPGQIGVPRAVIDLSGWEDVAGQAKRE